MLRIRPSFKRVDVLHHSIQQKLAGSVMRHLVNSDDDSAGRIDGESPGLDMGINHAPLARPVGANAVMTVNSAAFHPIRPGYIGLHRGQGSVDITGVKRRIGSLEQFSISA